MKKRIQIPSTRNHQHWKIEVKLYHDSNKKTNVEKNSI